MNAFQMENRRDYKLTDEQSELLRLLLVERIKSQVKDLEDHQLNELDCFDNANLIEEMYKTMKVLCQGDDYPVRILADKAEPEEEAVKEKDYFKTRDANELMESKDLETQVDKWIKRHEDEQQGPALF